MNLPAPRFISLVLAWCYGRIDPQKIEEWEFMLEAPLPGDEHRVPSQAELAEENAEFMRNAAALTGG
jgi:hypothetical protein